MFAGLGHDPDWGNWSVALATRVRRALGEVAWIEHIGSTAVPELAAKPIDDMFQIVMTTAPRPRTVWSC
ncbi:GrpB family protein [Streptomyces sp. JV185]|nr:GrpB family protein [Streptomyces sp. JV185]